MADRLRRARIDAGFDSAQKAAEAYGFNPPAYRHHENGTRPFDVETAKRYAKAYKVNPGWLLALDAIPAPAPERTLYKLTVQGAVAAGVWLEQTDWPEDDRYEIEVGPSPVPGAERFAVRMDGLSMDKTIPPGSDLECLRVDFGFISPRPGDLVIAARTNHNLTEMTCKRLDIDGEDWILRCESSQPEFQDVIRLGKPSRSVFADDEIKIVAIVLRAHQKHYRN